MKTVSLNDYKGSNIEKGYINSLSEENQDLDLEKVLEMKLEKGLIDQDLFEKAKKDLSKLQKVTRTNKNGKKYTTYVKKEETEKKEESDVKGEKDKETEPKTENTKTSKFLELLYENDSEASEEVLQELSSKQKVGLEKFFNEFPELLDSIVKFKGVPFKGDEKEYDDIIESVKKSDKLVDEVKTGYATFKNILANS